jgi:predicted nucleotide-binding protein
MTAPLVLDQEFVVHLFAPLDGPDAAAACQQVRKVWTACGEQLGMSQPIAGLPVPALLSEGPVKRSAAGIIAAQESQAGERQAVLRRVHDVLNLSAALTHPVRPGLYSSPAGLLTPVQFSSLPPQRRLGWADFAQIWAAQASTSGALLGETRLFLGRMPPGDTGAVEATAELGRSLDPLLPYREDRPADWWRWGTTTADGFALWDTRLAADTSGVREIVLIAAADRDGELSAWAWSDGTTLIPPFARYLLYASKLRYEARLLDAWHHSPHADDIDQVLAELNAVLAPDAMDPRNAGLLQSRLSRLRAEEARLIRLKGDLCRLRETGSSARSNIDAVPGCSPSDATAGMFAADQALARWLTGQVEDDLTYLMIDLDQVQELRSLAAEELSQVQRGDPGWATSSRLPGSAGAQPIREDVSRRVFVVHGRDSSLAQCFFDLLHSVDLRPLEWETLVKGTGSTAPYLGQVVARAPHLAQATLVLLTPYDIVELHSDLFQDNDSPQEQARSGQARPNVLFELGLALMAYPERTIVVEVGQMRPIADLAGLNVIRFDGSAMPIRKLLARLELAGCAVDDSGTDWLDPGRFASMAACQRGPGTHQGGP